MRTRTRCWPGDRRVRDCCSLADPASCYSQAPPSCMIIVHLLAEVKEKEEKEEKSPRRSKRQRTCWLAPDPQGALRNNPYSGLNDAIGGLSPHCTQGRAWKVVIRLRCVEFGTFGQAKPAKSSPDRATASPECGPVRRGPIGVRSVVPRAPPAVEGTAWSFEGDAASRGRPGRSPSCSPPAWPPRGHQWGAWLTTGRRCRSPGFCWRPPSPSASSSPCASNTPASPTS